MENGDGGARNKLPWWPKVGRWWNCGGGAVDGEVREWWPAAAMVMVGDEDVTTSSSSKEANPRRITRSMTKAKALSSLSLFCISLVSIS